MKSTTMKIKDDEFPMNILIKLWHEGTAQQIQSDLKTNRSFNNGTEDHINNCSTCQRKLASIDRKHKPL
jgi:hypothetical protein